MPTGVGAVVTGELDEVDLMGNRDRAGKIGQEDEARLQQGDQEQLAALVVFGDLRAELGDALSQLLGAEEDIPEEGVSSSYETRSSRYRWASRSMSRL